MSLTLNSNQFENIENIPEIVRTVILKISNVFVHLVVSENEKHVFNEKAKFDLQTSISISHIEKLLKIKGFIEDHFPIGTLARGAAKNSIFPKNFPTRNPSFAEKCLRRVRNGFRFFFWGHGDLDPARNCVPNPLATLPDPRNPIFRSKKGRNPDFRGRRHGRSP